MYVGMYECMYVFMCMYVYTCVCMYVCTYVCVYVYVSLGSFVDFHTNLNSPTNTFYYISSYPLDGANVCIPFDWA